VDSRSTIGLLVSWGSLTRSTELISTVFPFCHHDISSLPSQHQQVTKFLYFQWLALIVTLIVNLVGCILLLVSGSSQGG
jgi:hypothetical protein